MRTVLTIAGSDPSGGAGLQGDLKTLHACGVYGMAVPALLTVQNSEGVQAVHNLPAEIVARQVQALLADMRVDAIKTGALGDPETARAVAGLLEKHPVPHLVVDPITAPTLGQPLAGPDALDGLVQDLLPLATLVTPNVPEAEHLSGIQIRSERDMVEAARRVHALGAQAVLVKGGHLEGDEVVDLLWTPDGTRFERSPRVATRHTHGTGCAIATAVAAHLARGRVLAQAVSRARRLVVQGLRYALPLGRGPGSLNHLAAEVEEPAP